MTELLPMQKPDRCKERCLNRSWVDDKSLCKLEVLLKHFFVTRLDAGMAFL